MNRDTILARKKEIHKLFRERSMLAGTSAQMEEDIQRFNKGTELLLHGETYRACASRIENFSTVYGWIKRGTIPRSLRDSATRTKEIPARLRKKQQFAYLLGVYQSKVDEIHPERLTINTKNPGLETTLMQSFKALRMPCSKTIVKYADLSATRIYHDSKSLMSLIKEITEDNTSIPKEYMQNKNILLSYLQGFFDSRAVPVYTPNTIQSSSIKRLYPRIMITKSGNTSLMSAVNTALHMLGINSRYNPKQDPGQIIINEIESITKTIDCKLFRNKEKMQTLKDNYQYWAETKEYDCNGKFQKQKDNILLQKLARKSIKIE